MADTIPTNEVKKCVIRLCMSSVSLCCRKEDGQESNLQLACNLVQYGWGRMGSCPDANDYFVIDFIIFLNLFNNDFTS